MLVSRYPRTVSCIALIALVLAIVPVAATHVASGPAGLAAFCAAIVFANLLTAVLLGQLFIRDGSLRLLGLVGTYLYAASVVVPHAMSMPGVIAPQAMIGTAVTPTWLWLAWHVGFPIGLVVSLWGGPASLRVRLAASSARSRFRIIVAVFVVVPLGVVGMTAAIIGLSAHLPTLVTDTDYGLLARNVGPEVIGLNVAAVLFAIRATWRTTGIERWLVVVAAAALADAVLNLTAGGRFTVGWYSARALSLVTATVVLVALVNGVGSLYTRLTGVHEELKYRSQRDALTGLLHRGAVIETAERRLSEEPGSHAVALVDVDHFKKVNDAHGHAAGDAVLVEVANRLTCALGPDVVGRYGGEEFVLVLREADPELARSAVQHALDAIRSAPIDCSGLALRVTASAGVVVPPEGVPADAALASADVALYAAKAAGRDRVVAAWDEAGTPVAA